MPYVDRVTRDELSGGSLPPRHPTTAGELNYLITSLIVEYVGVKGLCYSTLNDVVGALECAKMELYRRVAAGYEDKAIVRNGDVYPQDLR